MKHGHDSDTNTSTLIIIRKNDIIQCNHVLVSYADTCRTPSAGASEIAKPTTHLNYNVIIILFTQSTHNTFELHGNHNSINTIKIEN